MMKDLGINYRGGTDFPFTRRQVLQPIQKATQSLSLTVQWPGHEPDHSLSSKAKVQACTPLSFHSTI